MNIGLVYAGGISKCAYQIGFTQALLRYVPYSNIKVLAGASMGLFTAYAVAADKLDVLQDIYEQVNVSHAVNLFRQVCFKNLLNRAMNSFFTLNDCLQIPVCFPITYIPLLSTHYFWIHGKYNPFWKEHFRAAANFPVICGLPKTLNHRWATDGGAVDNIPLYPVLAHPEEYSTPTEKLDMIIVLHFHARFDYRKEFRTDVPILDIDVSICNNFKKRHFDFSKEYIQEMILSSREYGNQIGQKFFSTPLSKNEIIGQINEVFLAEHQERQWHESADSLLTVLNTVGKTLRDDYKCSKRLY